MTGKPGLYHEFVLVDQAQFRQRHRQLYAAREQRLARLLLELPDRLAEVTAHQFRVP
ncbi:hypothetical protein CEV33_4576, partial [Brucella grignonensis]